nr:hypothetical protein [Prescottella equi]
IADVFVAMGWEVAEGPEVETEHFTSTRSTSCPTHPARHDAGHVSTSRPRLAAGAADPHVAGEVRTMLSREIPIYVVCPGRTFRTDELDATHTPGLLSGRGSRGGQGSDDGAPAWHARRLRPRAVRPETRTRMRPTTSRSPSRPPRWTCGSRTRRAGPAGRVGRLRHGQTNVLRASGIAPTSTPASPSVWASSGPCSSGTASRHARHRRGRRAVHVALRCPGLIATRTRELRRRASSAIVADRHPAADHPGVAGEPRGT